MSGRRLIEIAFAVLLGLTIYRAITHHRRGEPPKSTRWDNELGEIEAAFSGGTLSEIWSAIERLEKVSDDSERIKRIAERLCRLRDEPEFELIRSKLRRSALPAGAIELNCDGT